jgi:superfamily II helicase
MTTAIASNKVDFRLLGMLSRLVICSRCLQHGKVTPVPQVISPRHTPRSLCGECVQPQRRNLRAVLRHIGSR